MVTTPSTTYSPDALASLRESYALHLSATRAPRTQDVYLDALDSLIDMARWRHLPHALPGYILLGRLAGFAEPRLQAAWSEGKHQPLTEEIIKELTRKKK